MNKLECEMKKRTLEYRKEICENEMREHMKGIVLNCTISLISTLVAIWLIGVGVICLINGGLFFTILDFMLATIDIIFGVGGIHRVTVIKRSLVREKVNLEYLNSEIQVLDAMVV